MNTKTIKISLICLAVLASAVCLRAATIIKTNNTDNLNLTTSWVGGVVPGPFDVAGWDSTVPEANSIALGADTSWGGIIIANPGGPVAITAGNTLTTGASGIDMSSASQNLTISSSLTLGPGVQTWNVTNGMTLTVNGTFTRPVGAALIKGASTVAAASQGTVMCSPTLKNSVVPWAAALSSGTAANGIVAGYNFATVTSGSIVAYTGATPETTSGTGVFFGGIPTGNNSTANYDLGVASTGGSLANDLYVNTLRNISGAYTQPGTANFRANAIMNAGTGILTINTPIQQADTTLNEIVLAAWTSGITLNGPISNNVNPLKVTFTGTSSQNILIANASTFSGGVNINSVRVGIGSSSIPPSGTVTSGPLGTGTVTLNGGTLFSTVGGFAIGNPIIVGPSGGALQYASASPDLTINGNVTGSGPLTMAGVFNVNGCFLSGDDSAYNGTVTVTGSNNRLGTPSSGSALAKWVVNGALQANFIGGGTYYLGELSSTVTSGSLCGHAANFSPAIQNFAVGALNTSTTFSGIIVNNAAGNAQTGNSDAALYNVLALTKVGMGTLTLSGANTYTGPTTISGGSLQLGNGGTTGTLAPTGTIEDDANLTINHSNAVGQGTNFSSSAITGSGSFTQAGPGTTTLTAANTYTGNTLVSAGTLLVNGSIAGTATVMSGAKLGGNGTIGGVVNIQAGGQLGAGSTTTIGTLMLHSTPVLGGSVFVKLNAATAQADLVTVTGGNPINYGGSLVVSNIGVPLLAGDTFTIFNASIQNGNFSSIVGSPGTGLAYSFTNGLLTVVSTVASNPTNITATITTIGGGSGFTNTVTIAWPSDHTGWVLQSETNDVDGGLKMDPAAWFDLPGSTSVNLLNITNPTNRAVYFRLMYVAPPLPAAPPTGLTARATNHAVALSWTAPAYARSYNVKNATTSGGPYATVTNLIATSYTNFGLINGTTYYYVVSALNYNGETANSSEVSATPVAVPPGAPTGLTAMAAHGLVQLNWTAPVGGVGANSYNVKRGTTSGGPYTTITNVATSSFADTAGLVDGTTYYYVVSGVNFDGEGINSLEVSATPAAVPPTVPTGLTATGEYTQVRLSWTASFGATSYNVKSATTSGGPYTTFTNTSTTTVYNTGLSSGTPYYYIVTALNGIGESINSLEATATPSSILPHFYDFENTGANCAAPTLPAEPTPGTFTYIQPLPDPFTWISDPLNLSGTRSTNFSEWECLRNEHADEIQAYEVGQKPVVDIPSQVTASYSGGTLIVHVTANGQTLTLTCAVSIPSGSTAPYRVCIGMDSPYGSLNSADFTSRHIVGITYSESQVSTYGNAPSASDPYYKLYPSLLGHSGQYSAWAWGVSRVIDGLTLVTNLPVDLKHICVTGCSYAGKLALFSGAFDERVALTIAQESGGGGANSWRYNHTEIPGSVEDIDNTDYSWFMQSLQNNFSGNNVSYLPEDHHELMAMCAPRALYCTGNTDYTWLGNPSCYVCGQACAAIYNNFGIADRFGFNVDGGHGHCSFPSDQESDIQYFLNKFMLDQTNLSQIIRTAPGGYSGTNYVRWTSWWGITNPVLGPP